MSDYEAKYKALCGELMHRLTPGGSEFYMDPERCIQFAEKMRDTDGNTIRRWARRANSSLLMRWLWNRAGRRGADRA